jgi:hypothetical protein
MSSGATCTVSARTPVWRPRRARARGEATEVLRLLTAPLSDYAHGVLDPPDGKIE